jgi:hypothetical protein
MALRRAGENDLAARLFGGHPERVLALVVAAWPRAVGPDLARRTEVLGLENGTLRVRVPDARWRGVLHRMQPQILQALRRTAGSSAPRRMGFLEGAVPESAPAPPPALPSPEPDVPREVAAGAAGIADAEIRALFERAAARYLARPRFP